MYLKSLFEEIGLDTQQIVIHEMLLQNRYRNFKKILLEFSPLAEEFESHSCFESILKPNDMDSIYDKLKEVIQLQASLFQKLQKDIQNMNLADYVEELSSWAVGPQNVVSFLQFCFN